MQRKHLQDTLHQLIPISRAMGIEVIRLEPELLELGAPLALNHNHSGTGFAGSLYSLASLAGWGLLRHLVDSNGLRAELVLGKATIRYDRPATDDLRATVRLDAARQAELLDKLRRGEKARLLLEIALGDEETPVARFSGHYFAKSE